MGDAEDNARRGVDPAAGATSRLLSVLGKRLLQRCKQRWELLTVAFVGAISVLTLYSHFLQPEISPAIRGERVAREKGCFGCHGADGTSGIWNPGSASREVPGWEHRRISMYMTKREDLREWILYGRPRNSSMVADSTKASGLVPMPAYEFLISDAELDDLIAYLEAVSGWAADIPDEVYEGRATAMALGCFGCHGPSGMGAVLNPGALTGVIPPWDGEDFEELVRDEDELREWILDGKIARLWENRLARFFLERQTIKMPAYRGHISEAELTTLVSYVNWVRQR